MLVTDDRPAIHVDVAMKMRNIQFWIDWSFGLNFKVNGKIDVSIERCFQFLKLLLL